MKNHATFDSWGYLCEEKSISKVQTFVYLVIKTSHYLDSLKIFTAELKTKKNIDSNLKFKIREKIGLKKNLNQWHISLETKSATLQIKIFE